MNKQQKSSSNSPSSTPMTTSTKFTLEEHRSVLRNSLKEKPKKERSPSSSPIRRKCKSTANSKGNSSQGRYLTSRKSKSRADEKSSASSNNTMARVSKNA